MTAPKNRHANRLSDPILLRRLHSRADYLACVQLQRETWGAQFTELVPLTILLVTQRIGGVLGGAFDADDRLLGFVFGMTGVDADGSLVHWSDMLAVRRDARDLGIGRRLKEFQREQLLAMGIGRIYWTFDPLVARNAHLNLSRLGAHVTEYIKDMYGETDSELQRGLGTDRFVVAWDIVAPGMKGGRVHGDAPVINPLTKGNVSFGSTHTAVRIEIPADIDAIPGAEAACWRASTREAFLSYLANGYAVAEFYRDAQTHRCFYILVNNAAKSGAHV